MICCSGPLSIILLSRFLFRGLKCCQFFTASLQKTCYIQCMSSSSPHCTARRHVLKSLCGLTVLSWMPGLPMAATQLQGARDDPDLAIRDAIEKARHAEQNYDSDQYINAGDVPVLNQIVARLERLQMVVGYANFNIISYDQTLRYARHYSNIGAFSKREQDFIESVFSEDARRFGFFGQKVAHELTHSIKSTDIIRVKNTGHYLFKGEAEKMFRRLTAEFGQELELTSGIRSVVKQLYLFLGKVKSSGGNYSRAARSLAPPGHSFHGVGDFDVGQYGLGADNFTDVFSQSHIYKMMCKSGFQPIRYPHANPFGVRYEPWHIQVIKT